MRRSKRAGDRLFAAWNLSLSPSSILCLLLVLGLLLLVPSCTKQPQPYRQTRFLMGTLVEAVIYPDAPAAREAVDRAFTLMAGIEREAWALREGSPLYRLREGETVRFSGHLLRIMERAVEVAAVSGGAFDPAMGELVALWGIGGESPGIPESGDIANALVRKGPGPGSTAQEPCCPHPGTWLDLGGVGKGYAVDAAVAVLRDGGVPAGIINAGGDLRSWGRRPGRGYWRVGIQDPDDPQGLLGVLEIGDLAVATSGDYQRYFEKDGRRYHHILDPDTGYPADSGARSVTVLAVDCALADALATAAFVMGPAEGLFLLEGWRGVEGVIVDAEGTLHVTSGIGSVIPFERR